MATGWLPTTTRAPWLPSGTQAGAAAGAWLPTVSEPTIGSGVSTFGMGQSGLSLEESIIKYPESTLGQHMAEQRDAMMRKLGLDPETESPDTLAATRAETDAAIAKIATVNPDLAEQLLQRRAGEPEDQGFLDNIKETLAPVLSVGGKMLEILTRPSQIIPELIVDKEGDAWYEDIGQALSGRSMAHGDDVIRKVMGKDTPGWAQGLGGFAIDVLGDPLTWMTFGAAGVGRATAASALAEGGISIGLGQAAQKGAITLAGRELDDAALQLTRRLVNATNAHGDFATAAIAETLNNIPQKVVDDVVSEVNPVLRQFNRTGLHKLPKAEREKWVRLLEGRVKNLQSAGRGSEARALAGALGGVRIRAGIPFTSMRFTSAAIPGTYGMGFRPMSNFFRGMSGLNRLGRFMEESNPVIREQVFDTFFRDGWEGVASNYSALYKEVSGGIIGNSTSMFRTTSERVGRMTRALSNHSQFYRNGDLAALLAYNTDTVARAKPAAFLSAAWNVVDDKTGDVVRTEEQWVRDIKTTLSLGDPKKRAVYARYMEVVPPTTEGRLLLDDPEAWATARMDEIQGWVDRGIIDERRAENLRETITSKVARVEDIVNRSGLTPGEREILDKMQVQQRRAMKEHNAHGGGSIPDRVMTYEQADELDDRQIAEWAQVGDARLRDIEFNTEVEVPGVIRMHDIKNHDLGRGVRVSTREPGPPIVDESTPKIKDATGKETYVLSETNTKLDDGTSIVLREVQPTINRVEGGRYFQAYAGDEEIGQILIRRQVMDGGSGNKAGDMIVESLRTKESWKRKGVATKLWVKALEAQPDLRHSKILSDDAKSWIAGMDAKGITPPIPKVGKARVRVSNPLIVDEKQNKEFYDTIVAEVTDNVERMGLRENPHMLARPVDVEIQERIREGITRRLEMDGYDSVFIKEGDDWDGIVFGPGHDQGLRDRAHWNVKLHNPEAPILHANEGYFPRILSTEARKRIHGMDKLSDENDFLMFSDLGRNHELTRELAHMDVVEANAYLKQKWGLNGDAFIMDPLEAQAHYFTRMANDVRSNVISASGRRMKRGPYNAEGVGAAALVNQMVWGHPNSVANLAKFTEKHKALIEKNSASSKRRHEMIENATTRYLDNMAQLRSSLALEPGELSQFGRANKRLVGRIAVDATIIGRTREGIKRRMLTLEKELAKDLPPGKKAKLTKQHRELGDRLVIVDKLQDRVRIGDVSSPATQQATLRAAEKAGAAGAKRAEKVANLGIKKDRLIRRMEQQEAKAANELDKVRTAYQSEAAKLIPAIVEGTKRFPAGYQQIPGIEELRDLAFHPYIAAEFRHSLGNKPISVMRQNWRKFIQGPWKRYSTVYYPGFHARNFIGGWFNNWLGGVGLAHYMDNIKITKALQGNTKWTEARVGINKLRQYNLAGAFDVPDNEVTWAMLGDLMEYQGIRAANSNILGEAMPDEAARLKRATGKGTDPQPQRKVLTPARWYGKQMRNLTETTENLFRGAAWLQGMEATGSLPGARAFTMMRHGDYGDLNDYEQFIKDLVPFYKWMRTNIPLQIHNILEAPGRTLATVKASHAGYTAAGLDKDKMENKMGEWLKESFLLPIPSGKGKDALRFLSLDLPYADLYTGADDYISAFLPMIRPVLESSVWQARMGPGGEAIPLDEPKPLSAWAKLPGIRQIIDPFVTTDAEGNETISGRVQNVLGVIPIFSRFKNFVYADPQAQERRGAALWSVVTGLRYEDIGKEDLLAAEKSFMAEQVTPLIDGLRAYGVELPDADTLDPSVYSSLGLEAPDDPNSPWV